MNCPHCKNEIFGMTGFQEALAFSKHLRRCRKAPGNIALSDGERTVVVSPPITLMDALKQRADSGQ